MSSGFLSRANLPNESVLNQIQKQIRGKRKVSIDSPSPFHFPDAILDENFKEKRMHIAIYESKTASSIVKHLEDTAKKDYAKIKSAEEHAKPGLENGVEAAAKETAKIMQEIRNFHGVKQFDIILPIPNELSDSQTHSFSTDTGIVKDLADKANSMFPLFSIQKAIGQIASTLGTRRVLANPGFFQNYTGSDPRSFSFSFKLIPNSKEEAETIMKVIKLIKKYSSPSITADAIMIAPHFFHFYFSNTTLQNLTGIRPCVITDVSTNYAGSGILETTMDGMPRQINLSISMKELRTITEDMWTV